MPVPRHKEKSNRMTKYDKIFIPAQEIYERFVSTDPVIVITEEELLDLMQESIEHSYPTLLREKAKALLDAKLQSL